MGLARSFDWPLAVQIVALMRNATFQRAIKTMGRCPWSGHQGVANAVEPAHAGVGTRTRTRRPIAIDDKRSIHFV